jgi:hypothetical protein
MHHHNQHHRVWLVVVTTSAMLFALQAGGPQGQAQSLNDAPSHATASSMTGRGAESGTDLVDVDAAEGSEGSGDVTTANGNDDPTQPVSGNSDIAPAPSASTAASDEASVTGSEGDAVLEIPQVVNLPSGTSANRPTDEAAGNAEGNDADTAQSSQGGYDADTAQSGQGGNDVAAGDVAATVDQVGTLEDYENQAGAVPLGPIFFSPGLATVRLPRLPLFNPRPPIGVPMAASPIILPPTSSGPFPSTSPMLMAPRVGTLGSFPSASLMLMAPRVGTLGSFPRAGFMGFHR